MINCFKSLTHKRFRRPSKMFTAVVWRPSPNEVFSRPGPILETVLDPDLDPDLAHHLALAGRCIVMSLVQKVRGELEEEDYDQDYDQDQDQDQEEAGTQFLETVCCAR